MDKTFVPKGRVEPQWLLVDANGQSLGRLATQIARYLMGKHKPTFTPGENTGDYVIVVNASHLDLTNKQMDTKWYHMHSNYPGGLKSIKMRDQLRRNPERVLRAAVWGMIPHNKLGRQIIKKLKVYGENEHPHEAQQPQAVA